ncbi:hypothetical protein [Micromonospora sp. DT47]|uniref:hypothetical protein n=1 Tax=Micromonospora sp. DT47 TaxID=3393431 RepID=UPI003CF07C0A
MTRVGRPPATRPPGRRDSRRPAAILAPPTAAALPGGQPEGGRPGSRSPLDHLLTGPPRRTLPVVGIVGAAAVGWLAGGPVAGVVLAGYGVLAVRALFRRRAGRYAERERRRRLDQLCALAADLRAGLPVPALDTVDARSGALGRSGSPVLAQSPVGSGDRVLVGARTRAGGRGAPGTVRAGGVPVRRGTEEPGADDERDRLDRLTRAAVRLADRTGAPLAELLERIEADARALDRGLAAAAAQAAGARATALLLAALPLGGIGLGYGIGADPVRVLLHTPVGAASAVTAMGLQIAGLLWAERLGRVPDGVGR